METISAATAPKAKTGAIRVLIIEDHAAIIEMMTPIIESLPGYRVVGKITRSEDAVALATQKQPDAIVADWVMPRTSMPALIAALKRACPRARLVVFSGNMWSASIRAALSAGVDAVVEKGGSIEEFRAAMLAVGQGRAYFSAAVSAQIKKLVVRKPQAEPPPPVLSRRESTVLAYLAKGYSSKEIAVELDLSLWTVIKHRANLMKKAGVKRAAQLSLYAAQLGLVDAAIEHEGGIREDPAR